MNKSKLSNLPKTWLIDIDGTIFPHNNYLTDKKGKFEKPIDNVVRFIKKIPKEDFIVLLSARKKKYTHYTTKHLKKYGIRFNLLIMDLPSGERILINDIKPSGLKTAYAINIKRNIWPQKLKIWLHVA